MPSTPQAAPKGFSPPGLLHVAVLLAAADLLVLAGLALQTPASPGARAWTVAAAAVGLCLVVAVPLLALRRQRRAEALAEAASARHREALDAMQSAVVLWGADDRLISVNHEFLQVYAAIAPLMQPGVRFEDAMHATIAAGLVPEAVNDPEAWVRRRQAWRRNPQGPLLREMPDGRWRRIVEQRLSDGSLLAHSIDVTELVHREHALTALNQRLDELNAELSRLSETDELTGLPNRRLFDRRLAEECARAARHGTALALLMLDVDHFKRYNDLYGHPAGDECLRRVAEALRSTSRRPADLVARIGGEEFAMLLPHHTQEEARTQAERCAAALEAAAVPHGDSPVAPCVTLSIGGAQMAPPGVVFTAAELLRAADAALYQAKQAGRRRVVMRQA